MGPQGAATSLGRVERCGKMPSGAAQVPGSSCGPTATSLGVLDLPLGLRRMCMWHLERVNEMVDHAVRLV